MLHTSLLYFPKSILKNFQNFSFEPFKTLTSHFSMFETCNCQSFFAFRTSCFCFSRHFVENELSLQP